MLPQRAATEFLRSTTRVNALVFQSEMPINWSATGKDGSVAIGQFVYPNSKAALPIEDMTFLSRNRLMPELRSALKGKGPHHALRPLRDSEFYHWVDSLVS